MSLLLESWSVEPHIISPVTDKDVIRGVKNRSVRDEILRIIKLGAMEKDKVFRISILSQAFHLLDQMAAMKNSDAPHLYKTLVRCLLEHYKKRPGEPHTGEFILQNFIQLF